MSDHATEVVPGTTKDRKLAGVAVVKCTCGWNWHVEYTLAAAESMAQRLAAARGREHEGNVAHA